MFSLPAAWWGMFTAGSSWLNPGEELKHCLLPRGGRGVLQSAACTGGQESRVEGQQSLQPCWNHGAWEGSAGVWLGSGRYCPRSFLFAVLALTETGFPWSFFCLCLWVPGTSFACACGCHWRFGRALSQMHEGRKENAGNSVLGEFSSPELPGHLSSFYLRLCLWLSVVLYQAFYSFKREDWEE